MFIWASVWHYYASFPGQVSVPDLKEFTDKPALIVIIKIDDNDQWKLSFSLIGTG
jgi:hypothetical protein